MGGWKRKGLRGPEVRAAPVWRARLPRAVAVAQMVVLEPMLLVRLFCTTRSGPLCGWKRAVSEHITTYHITFNNDECSSSRSAAG